MILRDLDLPDDLSGPRAFRALHRAAEELAEREPDPEALRAWEAKLAAQAPPASVPARIAVKLARSRCLLARLPGPAFVSLVFALYKEHRRILAPEEDPLGEDFLRRKLEQLEWLLGARADIGWELILVDDGCPEGSGRIARDRIDRFGYQDRARVLFLEQAIAAGDPAAAPLRSAAESQKGGSILYGMATAARTPRENHVVAFTDADLSTHVGQLGLLLDPIGRGALAAIGSRREPTSVVVKRGTRDERGKLFIYLWKQLLPPLAGIVDTQCGFKAFAARILPGLLPEVREKRFAFDIELLLRAELLRSGSVVPVPVAWIDSEVASTTTDLQPYLPMLKSVAAMYRRLLPPSDDAEGFAQLVEELDEASWQRLLGAIPAPIAAGDPAAFGGDAVVGVDELRAATRALAETERR